MRQRKRPAWDFERTDMPAFMFHEMSARASSKSKRGPLCPALVWPYLMQFPTGLQALADGSLPSVRAPPEFLMFRDVSTGNVAVAVAFNSIPGRLFSPAPPRPSLGRHSGRKLTRTLDFFK